MIFIGTHHKSGTHLLKAIFGEIAQALQLKYFGGWQKNLPPGAQVWFMPHSRIDASSLSDIRGIHVIRDPLNLIYSAYQYHKVCDEPWAIDTGKRTGADGIGYEFDGMSYQQKLNSCSEAEGLALEMRGRSREALFDMYQWDYGDKRFLNVRLERITDEFDASFAEIFDFLGLSDLRCMEIARRHDIHRWPEAKVLGTAHVTDKTRKFEYRNHFSAGLLQEFESIYPPDIFWRLGYRPKLARTQVAAPNYRVSAER